MKTTFLFLFSVLAAAFAANAPAPDLQAVRDLAVRVLGEATASEFAFEPIGSDPESQNDVYEYASNSTHIVIRGNTGVSLSTGLYHYLKDECGALVTWGDNNSGRQLNLPSPLPRVASAKRQVRFGKYFYSWNVCTYGYTAWTWDWSRWEEELDWMALHGVNFPLAFAGQEYIWYELWSSFGLTEAEIQRFFSGPAFLPWQRMGNVRGWAGPLDATWRENRRSLQHQILDRMRSFGMLPVAPGFGGHVPEGITRVFPNISVTTSSGWGNFNSTYSDVYLLEPTDSHYSTIGQSFYRMYIQEFGDFAAFNMDTYNEMDPKSTDLGYLKQVNEAVFGAMAAVAPDSTYVMQGWLFHSGFWTPQRTQAFLSGVPLGKMIILDLNSETQPLYNYYDQYYGHNYIWNLLHNYGSRAGMYGNLTTLNTAFAAAGEANSTMVGVGFTPEAIEQNPVMYEMLSDVAWSSGPLVVSDWLTQYVKNRYNAQQGGPELTAAWATLRKAGYEHHWDWNHWSVLEYSPAVTMTTAQDFNATGYAVALRHLYNAGFGPKPEVDPSLLTYQYDLVDLTRQVVSDLMVDVHGMSGAEFQRWQFLNQNSSAGFDPLAGFLMGMVDDMERVLSTNQNFLFGYLVHRAITVTVDGGNATQVSNRLFNQKNQVTLWGPSGQINDYSARQYAGLVGTYHRMRWKLFLSQLSQSINSGVHMDFDAYLAELLALEQQWNNDGSSEFPATPSGDLGPIVKDILGKYVNAAPAISAQYTVMENTDYSGADMLQAWTKDVDQLMIICSVDPNCVGFNSNGWVKNSTATNKVPYQGSTFYRKVAGIGE